MDNKCFARLDTGVVKPKSLEQYNKMESTKPQPLTLLVLSDLHFGNLAVSKEFALPEAPPSGIISGAVSMKESLIQVTKNENVGAILVAGDLTSCGSPEEFVGCMSTLEEIAQQLNVSQSNIIYAYGNHDVDWQITRIPGKESSGTLKELYLRVGACVGDILLPRVNYDDKGPVPGCGLIQGDNFRIFVVNSGYYCSHDQKYRHGKLGEDQRLWLKEHLGQKLDDDKWHVLLLHHHPFNYRYPFEVEDISCLEEGDFLMDLIGKSGIDFVCHGHRHHPMLFTEIRTGWISPVTLLCAGSLAVNEQQRCGGQIPNLFHLVSFESRLDNRSAVGRVKTFEYSIAEGWKASLYDARVPLDAVQRFADVYDHHSKINDLSQVIESCIAGTGEGVFDLTKYEDLPLSLQCMPIRELNKMLRSHLCKQKYQIIGEFPKSVMVRKSRNA